MLVERVVMIDRDCVLAIGAYFGRKGVVAQYLTADR